jgi:hypothetical protein
VRIHILALNGVLDTGLAAVLDAFGFANALAEKTGISSLRFETKVVGLRKTVTTGQGLSVPVTSAARAQTPDAVVMPAINQIMPEPLLQALASGEVREAGAVLRKWSGRGALTAAPALELSCWRTPPCSTAKRPPPPGGWHLCSGSAIRGCGCSRRDSSCNPTR